jgi:hypothetical protein
MILASRVRVATWVRNAIRPSGTQDVYRADRAAFEVSAAVSG